MVVSGGFTLLYLALHYVLPLMLPLQDPVIKQLFDLVSEYWPVVKGPRSQRGNDSQPQEESQNGEHENPEPAEADPPAHVDGYGDGDVDVLDGVSSGDLADLANELGVDALAMPVEPLRDSQIPEDSQLPVLEIDTLPQDSQPVIEIETQPLLETPSCEAQVEKPQDPQVSGSPCAPTVLEATPEPSSSVAPAIMVFESPALTPNTSEKNKKMKILDSKIAELKQIFSFIQNILVLFFLDY